MGDVTFMGLGAMGAALAGCAQKNGYETTVWNRTAAKAEPLVALGARYVANAGDAIAASPLTVICVSDYEASDSLVMSSAEAIRGRTVIQLTTGSAKAAREGRSRLRELGAEAYLDGAIMDYPSGIGSDNTLILASGDLAAFETAEPLMRRLAPATKYLGDDPGFASTLDQALLSPLISMIVGTINGAALCEAGGLPLHEFRETIGAMIPVMDGAAAQVLRKIEADDLETTEASLDTYAGVFGHMAEAASDGGFSSELPAAFARLFDRAQKRGLGAHDVGALIRVLRPE